MKKLIISFVLILPLLTVWGQQEKKVFWKEDFSGGHLPDGWVVKSLGDSTVLWQCTDQPYPGSYQHSDQAPPIASSSRGYFMMFSPGVKVDRNINKWRDAGVYPDGYFMTAPINCTGLKSAILRFEQKFAYNPWGHTRDAGLFVGVSNDGKKWKYFRVNSGVKGWKDSPNPVVKELNVSDVVAGRPQVYIKFLWKGYFAFYWMVDDIALLEGYRQDLGVKELLYPAPKDNVFTDHDTVRVTVKNMGSEDITRNFKVEMQTGDTLPCTVLVKAEDEPFPANSTMEVSFCPADLSTRASWDLHIRCDLPGDEDTTNNKATYTVYSKPVTLGNITGVDRWEDGSILFRSGRALVAVRFLTDEIFRLQLAPLGNIEDPTHGKITVKNDFTPPKVDPVDRGDYYAMTTGAVELRAYKKPLRFACYDKAGKLLWEEASPLEYGATTRQRLRRQPEEYFYGGGMQNGYFSHRDSTIRIEIGGGWDDGGRPNPVPFYMSTAGYGVFRNTFAPGRYSFHDPLDLSHEEFRFDAYYFYGPSLKKILDEYTQITGRPFMPPRWALEMGDANCYNRNGHTTPVVIDSVARKYREHDMPGGWILPNDGYGCGYTDLPYTVKELHKLGFWTGLWTENGVDRIAWEVGTAGTRLCKLDVAWVYRGYEFALDACRTAYTGIENNCDGRGFVWTVMGWAGTQRYATVWSGDQKGNWEYIRFHIPTVIGAGLSAFNAATGDVDGIFGGSPETYVRDLQWKCFTPVLMGMSGWSKYMKQPYVYGEPYTSINRRYLKLKMRLTPYLYTYSHQAWSTGTPTVRGMVLEFPEDPVTWGKATQYQFMTGEWLLVAPVYRDTTVRDSIYLPAGIWTDYWTGKTYTGPMWLNGYEAPLDRLPLLVRGGAIIPMYPGMLYDGQKPKDPVTLDLYPSARETHFDLYEDDGITREYRKGIFAETRITLHEANNGTVTVQVAPVKGSYKGMPGTRHYVLQVHREASPEKVLLNGKKIKRYKQKGKWEKAATGWFFDPEEKQGVVFVKTGLQETGKGCVVTMKDE